MKVLITGPSLDDPGGVAGYYNSVLPHLRVVEPEGINYMEIGGTHSSLGFLHPLNDQVRFFRTLRRLRPDVVHVNPSLGLKSFLRDGIFVMQAVSSGFPVVVFFRGWEKSFEGNLEKWWMFFFRRTYLKASAFVVLASDFRSKLLEWGIKAPIMLTTTTVSSDLLSGFSIQFKLAEMRKANTFRVLFLARLARAKGALESMEAVSMLRKEGYSVRITVAGDGEAMPDVAAYAQLHDPKGEYIDVVGDVRGENKIRLLASHHLYSFPSTHGEGMPNSVLEAMAFGMAVLACPTGGVKDFFVEPDMGLILARRDSREVAAGLRRIFDDPASLYRIAAANYEYAKMNFVAPNASKFLMRCYEKLAQDSAGELST